MAHVHRRNGARAAESGGLTRQRAGRKARSRRAFTSPPLQLPATSVCAPAPIPVSWASSSRTNRMRQGSVSE
eukprot:3386583-Rhodomonas_salina.3